MREGNATAYDRRTEPANICSPIELLCASDLEKFYRQLEEGPASTSGSTSPQAKGRVMAVRMHSCAMYLRSRQTSRLKDLPICFATLLGLDTGPLRARQGFEDRIAGFCDSKALSWLQEYSTQHTPCASLPAIDPILPKRVLEIAEDKSTPPRLFVAQTETRARFIALSHCWGQCTDMTKLGLQNEATWQHGIDLESLSLNFQDAITITRRLGIRYLWIDALCILQDSAADWLAESPKMTSVFGTATLVLSATSAKHCNEGIFLPRLLIRSPALGRKKHTFLVPFADIDPGPKVRPNLTESFLEPGPPSDKPIVVLNVSAHPDFPNSKRRRVQHLITRWHQQSSRQVAPHTNLDPDKAIQAWFSCIEEYSPRKLTFSTDKLPAVAGLAALFQFGLANAGEYLAGLWSGYLVRCLSWEASGMESNRASAIYRAPSWSWAACDCGVTWAWESRQYDPSPASIEWPNAYNPRLVSHEIVPVRGDGPEHLMGAEEGSYIALEGFCTPFRGFRCSSPGDYDYVDQTEDWKYIRDDDECEAGDEICAMHLQWAMADADPVDDDTAKLVVCALLLVRTGNSPSFRRFGLLRRMISRETCYINGEEVLMSLEESYDSVGWERKLVKII
ncbi:heterokaryon incompatibility protein-domain-containing protein [Lasiosphaeria ovina]|uniref:Heterokaryon incompatibility protein-domain-containing protein n=1 Tax=Lasiosphaeria ovina TaxID=92902 RepID=A0AAE0MYC0_9PEZI|nr:heterokaryon incompatibility protein-domain-containing protein [Lasiosphaeria ovina]